MAGKHPILTIPPSPHTFPTHFPPVTAGAQEKEGGTIKSF